MSPGVSIRRLGWGWMLALYVCLAPAASAETKETQETKVVNEPRQSPPRQSPPRQSPPRQSPTDLIGDQLPGDEAVQSLRHVLSVPTASTRWHGLSQFGRELFQGTETRFGPIEDVPVGPDYVLGPGDNLVVFISGFSDTSFAVTLDREGKVFLPRVGTTFLWGLSFADAEALIRARLATVLRNARVQVSMGRVRALDVFALGAVVRPGKITLTGLGTAFNALYAAGGPDSLGSLRDIRVMRANREIARLDLYPVLLNGDRASDVRLQNGDVVFVGLARSLVGIQGAVARPGVYEGTGPLSLRDLLDMAGGPSPFADLSRIHIERVDANGGFRLQDLPLDHGKGVDPDSLKLLNYDLVTVLPLNERVRNVITLDGFVRHPGEYELTAGLKLSELVRSDRLLPEASLDQAELRRVDATTCRVEVRPFSVRRAWSGEEDLPLQPLDAVTVFSSARFPRSVTLEGEVTRPGTYTIAPGERLSAVLERAGGLTPQGYLRAAIFIRQRAAERERTFLREFVERQRLELAQQQVQLAQSGDSTATQAAVRAQAALTAALESQTEPGRVVLDLDEKGNWVGTVKDPVLEGGDRLVVPPRPATVTVLGSVMNPGTVLARKNASLQDYLKLAGGVSHQGDVRRSYVLKANGEAIPRRSVSRVEAGDAIIVPPREISTGSLGRSLTGGARFLMELATVAALVLAAVR
jgi:polysaccharide biosynthesis/export protein